jgi:FAD/FMN-containing dehydrogenase
MKIIKNKIVYEDNINNIKGKANAIVFPDSIQEIKNIIKVSNEDIIFRGSGTSFTGAVVPFDSTIMDFSKMNNIIELNESKKTVTLEPGVLLSELNEELAQKNLEFPINPIFGDIETIGGMIAKNSSGNREIKYGRMLNWTDSLEVIDGKAEQIKISKSDLSDYIGMEGTTGAIVKIVLRLTNKKSRSLTILKSLNLEEVFVANRKLRLKQDISSIDLLSKDLSVLLGLENKYHIFVETENEEGNFKGPSYIEFLKLKNKAYKKAAVEGFFYMTNVKFLIDSLQDFLLYLEDKKIPFIGHLASGVIFPLFKPDQIEKMQEAMKFAKRLRGRIAYNFGVGFTKKEALDPGEIELIRRVKNRRDPEWKFNKNKLIDIKFADSKKEIKPEKEVEEKQEIKKENTQENPEDKRAKLKEEIKELMKNSEGTTLRREEPELSPEEREKIKKIASGFFGGGK